MTAVPDSAPQKKAAPSSLQVALGIVQTMRPRQWVKNLFVAAPLVFGKHLADPRPFLRALAAFGVFCAVASAVYLWNDLVDIEKDRAHARKRHRPIPSGKLPVPAARAAAASLAALGVASALVISVPFALCVGAYLLNNVAYSLWLKKVVYVDVLSIAAGFILRVISGGFAIDVYVTPYLLLCTFLLACYSGFGKRAHELAAAAENGHAQRPVLRGYSAPLLRWALVLLGVLTLGSYVAYTRAEHTVAFFGTSRMIYTAPFAALGMIRFWFLVQRDDAESPTEALLRDVPFMLNLALWAGAVVLIIYYH
jgi:4-hydroxybenzoate polyprenyltransferase